MLSSSFIYTKLIATIGPASADAAVLTRMIEEGVRVVRINFSHGSFDDFARMLDIVREAERSAEHPVAVLGDLCGPKIRVEGVPKAGVMLDAGQTVHFVRTAAEAEATTKPTSADDPVVLATNYPAFVDEVVPGQRVLIDDGAVRMLVIDKQLDGAGQPRLIASVTVGGLVLPRKGANLPDTDVNAPSLTDYDWQCVRWALDHQVDYLALSFVRRADDVRQLKAFLDAERPGRAMSIPVIAKIEKPQAMDDLQAIAQVSDGVMVARGDLGVEMDLARVPIIQRQIIRCCHDYGKPVIVATQMLQSMIDAPNPTRAEVSDVANAILEGADAVMLSGETAVGKYPVQAAHMIGRIARATETHMRQASTEWSRPPRQLQQTRYRTAALAHGVSVVVRDLDARLVVTWSQMAGSARYLSQNRLHVPIVAASSSQAALRRMGLMYGVMPMAMKLPDNGEQFLQQIDSLLQERQWARPGDPIVLVIGEPLDVSGVSNELRVHFIGDTQGPSPLAVVDEVAGRQPAGSSVQGP